MSIESAIETDPSANTEKGRSCPFCSATMLEAVSLCGACGRFSRPIVAAKPMQPAVPIIARINTAIARGEAQPEVQRALRRIDRPLNVSIPRTLRWIAAVILLALGVMRGLLQWLYNGSWLTSEVIGLIVIGAVLLLGPQLLRPGAKPAVEPSDGPQNDVSIHVLGYDVNLALLQTLAFGALVVFAFRYDIDTAQRSAIVACLMVPLLWSSKLQKFALGVGLLSLWYLVYIWTSYDYLALFEASINSRSMPYVPSEIVYFIWTVMTIAVIPQLQIPRIGKVGIGRMKGDFSVKLFGGRVPVAFTSALILTNIISALLSVWYAPGTIWALQHELF